jgi:hypothetical protein
MVGQLYCVYSPRGCQRGRERQKAKGKSQKQQARWPELAVVRVLTTAPRRNAGASGLTLQTGGGYLR